MKYKVLVVGAFRSREFGVLGGIARSCDELIASEFVERFDVSMVDSTQRANPPPNVFARGWFAAFRQVKFIVKLARYRPDCVLLFFSSGMSFYEKALMGWLAKFFGAKVFLFPRAGALMTMGYRSKIGRIVQRSLFQCGDVFLAQGLQWQNYAVEICRYPKGRTYIVPNWTGSDEYYALGSARMRNMREKVSPTLAFVGWLEAEKGVRELLMACAMLAKSGLQFSCVLAGDGTQKMWVEEFIEHYKLGGVVTLKGWLNGSELTDHYRNADIFVLPSWNEGMPNSLIEAMSSGLCPVVTSVGNIPDFVRNGEHGLVIEPNAAEELYAALSILITTPSLQLEYSRAAYELSKQFDKNYVIPLLCDIIETNLPN